MNVYEISEDHYNKISSALAGAIFSRKEEDKRLIKFFTIKYEKRFLPELEKHTDIKLYQPIIETT